MMYTDTSTDTHTHCMNYHLDVCLGDAILRKDIVFPKKANNPSLENHFHNNLGVKTPCPFSFYFLNQNANES